MSWLAGHLGAAPTSLCLLANPDVAMLSSPLQNQEVPRCCCTPGQKAQPVNLPAITLSACLSLDSVQSSRRAYDSRKMMSWYLLLQHLNTWPRRRAV